MKKKLWVFDLDGTLVDSIGDIAAAVNRSLIKLGRPTHSVASYYQMVGDGMAMLCQRALGEDDSKKLRQLITLYQEDYINHCCEKTVPYAGILDLLSLLKEKGIQTAIISNKPQTQSDRVVSGVLGQNYFTTVLGQSEHFPKKPNPAVFEYLLSKLGIAKEDVLYVGDSNVDMVFAKKVGVLAIGAAWGFRGATELQKAGADAIAEDVASLQAFF